MSALVALQSTILTKLHLAHIAFLRFLVRVNTHVGFQMMRFTKTLLAHITFIRLLVRVRTHVYGQLGWISKHLLANIALVLLGFLSLHSFSRRRHFFSQLLLLEDFKNDFILVRNLQTQHLWFFFLFLQNRPRIFRSFRMWIFPSSSHYYF